MQMNYDALETHLKKGLSPLYVLTGDEYLLMNESVDLIRSYAKNQTAQRQILTAEANFKWELLLQANIDISLFGENKLIELRIPTGKLGKDGAKALQSYISQLNPDNITIITLPRLDKNSKKSVWFQKLTQEAVLIEVPTIERHQLAQWIIKRLHRQEQSADAQSVEFIANRVEGNLLAAYQEIQKLALLLPKGELSFSAVCDAVMDVSRYNIFQLNEAMLSGNISRFIKIMEGLKGEGEPLPLVQWVFTEEIRMLLRCKIALENRQPIVGIKRSFRVWGAHETLVNNSLPYLDKKMLLGALTQLAEADKIIKGLKSKTWTDDAWSLLIELGMSVAQAAKRHTYQ